MPHAKIPFQFNIKKQPTFWHYVLWATEIVFKYEMNTIMRMHVPNIEHNIIFIKNKTTYFG
jgi:hypothetical protein